MANNPNNKLQKQESLFGLVPEDGGLFGLGTPMYNPSRATTREEQWLTDRYRERMRALEVAPALGIFGLEQISKVHKSASDKFTQTALHVMEAKNDAQGSDALPYVDEFSRLLVTRCGRHMFGIVDLVDTQIGTVISEPVIPPVYKPIFWEKLLGKG